MVIIFWGNDEKMVCVAEFVFPSKITLNSRKLSDLTKTSLEGIWIEIAIRKLKLIIFGCFYRPPETFKYFTDDFDALLSKT